MAPELVYGVGGGLYDGRGMLVRLLFVVWLCGAFVGGAQCATAAPAGIRVGGWAGGPVHDAKKQFAYCSASATNGQGIVISYSVDAQYRWRLSFSNPTWSFSPGYSLNLLLRFSEKSGSVRARAIVNTSQMLEVHSDDDLALFAALWDANKLQVTAGGLKFEFELIGSNEILSALLRCALRQSSPPRRPNQETGLPMRVDAAISQEARELLTEILAFARLREARILPTAANSAVTWKTNLITSSLGVIDGNISRMSDIPVRILDREVRHCRNEAFFAWSVLEVDGADTTRVITICAAQDGTAFTRYTLTPRGKGGIYLMTSTVTGGGFGGVLQAQLDEIDARLRSAFIASSQQLTRATAPVPNRESVDEKVNQPERSAPFARE